MFSFLISIVALLAGYFLYGRLVEHIYKPDPTAITPANAQKDGVDYIPMPNWKVFMIQFLNIAGTGPIFGAIMGAQFGPSCYLWIVFGCIFAGAVHDYMGGMISMKYGGVSIADITGHYFGKGIKILMTFIIMLLLILVGAVFVYSPALILGDIAGFFSTRQGSVMFWVVVIFAYYFLATLMPIDKIIGRIYPVFAFSLLFMAVALFVCLLAKWPVIPEFWDGLQNRGPQTGMNGQSIFPCLFITVACGAISGFHGTQSPLMARCIKSETSGRRIFYGAMITEGLVALVWAAVGSYFFFDGGMAEVGAAGSQAPEVVTSVAKSWLGVFGSVLALLGVVAAPITSGDTAMRSARLIVAGLLKIDQKPIHNRLRVCIPIFVASMLLLWFNIADEDGFNTIWRYFGWFNQTLACFMLWTLTLWLVRHRKGLSYLVTLVPACFMTSVCVTYICIQKIGFNIPDKFTPWIACVTLLLCILLAVKLVRKHKGVALLADNIV